MTVLALCFFVIAYAITLAIIAFIGVCLVIILITKPYPVVERYEEEGTYYDSNSKTKKPFPSINEAPSVTLSVVVPAYNEEQRLTPMLDEAIEFLDSRVKQKPKFSYEIIVVSDGSTDGTVALVDEYSYIHGSDKVRCLNLVKNRGKGGAVRLGVEKSRGGLILFADADGATKFEDLYKLESSMASYTLKDPILQGNEIGQDLCIVIGSRAHLEEESLATRSVFRNILMYGFHFLVWFFTVKGIRDTQCGFKLFTRQAASKCFQSLHVTRWAFDVELLYIAQKLKIHISEVPVRWTEIDGSKVTPVLSWIQMGIDLALIWLKYLLGAWKINSKKRE